MNDELLQELIAEVASAIQGKRLFRLFQLATTDLALDFGLKDGRYLFISVAPVMPRLYLIRRTVRQLEKGAVPPSNFLLLLRKYLVGATLRAITKDQSDRIVRLLFDKNGESKRMLVAQLTGRSANLFLLDEQGRIADALRALRGSGQQPGEPYLAPTSRPAKKSEPPPFARGAHGSLSEAADDYYLRLEAERRFDERVRNEIARLEREIEKRRRLLDNLREDRAAHGEVEEHRRIGELLLANLTTAERVGEKVRIRDFYADDAPWIEVEIGAGRSLQQEAEQRFARYARAKRAAERIEKRVEEIAAELRELEMRRAVIEQIRAARDEQALARISPSEPVRAAQRSVKKDQLPAGIKRYRSSEGYEILVGRGASENDLLTFRLARPHDLWLHAADYPGAHVVVRNPQRAEIPQRTLIEAAQLAAAFSQARADGKVAVHYAWRKHISKPRNAPPGTVTVAGARTLMVAPRADLPRAE